MFRLSRSRPRVLSLIGAVCLVISTSASAGTESDIEALRRDALALVNDRRGQEDLPPLEGGAILDRVAQKHAEDMIARGYFGHASPEGDTVQARYRQAGGSRWELVAENIAECRNCGSRTRAALVRRFQAGWMDSLAHRINIMRLGIERFGFGLAASEDGRVAAVQVFAGAGRPHGLAQGESADATPSSEQRRAALDSINRARRGAGLKPLRASVALDRIAAGMLPAHDQLAAGGTPGPMRWPPAAESVQWRSLRSLRAFCGGCGRAPTTADARFFTGLWLDDQANREGLLAPAATHLGFALRAGGDGRKAAVLVIGRTS